MPSTPGTLVDRWRLGTIPGIWEIARGYLVERLGDLERILAILHGAVEHPQPSLDQRVNCTLATTINSTTAADITGATVTIIPTVDMTIEVVGVFDVFCSLYGAAGIFIGTLVVNGSALGQQAIWRGSAVSERLPVMQLWAPTTLKSGTAYTIKMQAATTDTGTTFSVNPTHTGFTIKRFPNGYRPS